MSRRLVYLALFLGALVIAGSLELAAARQDRISAAMDPGPPVAVSP